MGAISEIPHATVMPPEVEKEKEEEEEEVWTQVRRKPRRGRNHHQQHQKGRPNHVIASSNTTKTSSSAGANDPPVLRPRSTGPFLTLEEIKRDHERVREQWDASSCRQKLRAICASYSYSSTQRSKENDDDDKKRRQQSSEKVRTTARVSKAICFGVGTFDPEDGGWEVKRRAHAQLCAFLDMVRFLEGDDDGEEEERKGEGKPDDENRAGSEGRRRSGEGGEEIKKAAQNKEDQENHESSNDKDKYDGNDEAKKEEQDGEEKQNKSTTTEQTPPPPPPQQSKTKIKVYIQEPLLTTLDTQFIESTLNLGPGTVVSSPLGFDLVDASTLAFGVHLYRDVYSRVIGDSDDVTPAVFVGTGLDVWDAYQGSGSGMEEGRLDWDRMRDLDGQCERIGFPRDDEYASTFSSTSIHWRRE